MTQYIIESDPDARTKVTHKITVREPTEPPLSRGCVLSINRVGYEIKDTIIMVNTNAAGSQISGTVYVYFVERFTR